MISDKQLNFGLYLEYVSHIGLVLMFLATLVVDAGLTQQASVEKDEQYGF